MLFEGARLRRFRVNDVGSGEAFFLLDRFLGGGIVSIMFARRVHRLVLDFTKEHFTALAHF